MPAEVFDEQRRAWIAAHAGIFLFQKRRAELLGKKIRAHAHAQVGARPDPHDDHVTPPLVFRTPSTSTGGVETALVAIGAVAAPVGWLAGRVLYCCILTLIPEKLRAYPIPALVWTAGLCGAPLPVLFDPSPTLWSALVAPWLLAQIPATFLAAGIYGALEGWLAVDGSTDWWPLTPVAVEVDDDLILGPGNVAMPTVLDPTSQSAGPAPTPRRRVAPRIRWVPLLSGGVLVTVIIAWYCVLILSAALDFPGRLDSHSDMIGTTKISSKPHVLSGVQNYLSARYASLNHAMATTGRPLRQTRHRQPRRSRPQGNHQSPSGCPIWQARPAAEPIPPTVGWLASTQRCCEVGDRRRLEPGAFENQIRNPLSRLHESTRSVERDRYL